MECEYCSGSGRSIDLEMPGQDEVCWFCNGTGQTQHIVQDKKSRANKYGEYSGRIQTEWLDDGRNMVIINNVYYYAPDGSVWHVKPGDRINGASIPRFVWPLFGSPFVGKYRAAAGFHDPYCVRKNRPWKDVHSVMKPMMLCSGVSESKAEVIYRAVRHFGPKW